MSFVHAARGSPNPGRSVGADMTGDGGDFKAQSAPGAKNPADHE
jgi:hypothetical protein